MSRRDKFLVAPMVVLFMFHGLLYYIFPEQHYTSGENSGGWLSYIKYLCVMIALPALVRAQFPFRTIPWITIGISMLALTCMLQLYWAGEGNLLLMQFQMVVFGYFFGPFLLRFFEDPHLIRHFLFGTILVTFLCVLGEIIAGGSLGLFSRSGFRGVGPFVNPNNTGLIVAILASIHHFHVKQVAPNVIVGLIATTTLVVTGSKTAMIVYLAGLITAAPLSWLIFILVMGCIALVSYMDTLAEVWSLLELREMSLESGEIRSEGVTVLLRSLAEGPFVNLLFGTSNQSLVDNAYLDMMMYGGVMLLISFIAVQIFAAIFCFRNRYWLALMLHGLFFLSMLTTNIPRLWPTGYFYWALVSISFLLPHKTKFASKLHLKHQTP